MYESRLTTIPSYWDNAVAKFPNAPAAMWRGEVHSYARLDEQIARLAGYLRDECGVGPGDRVAIALPNCLECLTFYWAALRLGAIAAPVNIRLRDDELAYVLRNIGPKVVALHEDTPPGVWEAVEGEIIQVGEGEGGRDKSRPYGEGEGGRDKSRPYGQGGSGHDKSRPYGQGGSGHDKSRPYGQAVAHPRPAPTSPDLRPEDVAVLLHTSGTTGEPKGAIMTHETLAFNVRNAIFAHSFRHEDVHLLVIPFFAPTASYSLLASSAYLGSCLCIAPRPDIGELIQLIRAHRCTTFIGVPTLFHLFVSDPRLRPAGGPDASDANGAPSHSAPPTASELRSLRLLAYSGSPMPVRTIHRLRDVFPGAALHNFFGLTETISITHVLPSVNAADRPESIGKPLPEIFTRIIDEEGEEVPRGEVGELCFARENVIPGYWNKPGLLEEAIHDGWFRTGDFARVDEEGFFYVHGRKKEMIIVAGQNVYALEVEKVIYTHPAVRDAAVVGVPATGARAALGELVKAVVVAQPGEALTELDIKRHCAERLPSYKVPQVVEFRAELPRNPAGKVLKRDLL